MIRKIIMALLIMLGPLALSAKSAHKIVSQFEELADKVEEDGGTYTEEQWADANAVFDGLVTDYQKAKGDMSSDDKKAVQNAMGRYRAAVMKSDFKSAKDAVGNTFKKVSESTSEAFSGVKGFFHGLGKKKK